MPGESQGGVNALAQKCASAEPAFLHGVLRARCTLPGNSRRRGEPDRGPLRMAAPAGRPAVAGLRAAWPS